MQQPMTLIQTRGYRKRRWAEAILALHPIKPAAVSSGTTARCQPSPIRVVCVSDTHNKQPALPPGDILIHAGDLTENGSFDEVQAGITWLSSQPHRFKIFVAGNHDVLLDEAFLARYPERRYGQAKTRADLDWGDVIYLEDEQVTLDVPLGPPAATTTTTTTTTDDPASRATQQLTRAVTVFGSPWTPQYGVSAFQYRPDAGPEHWSSRLASLPGRDTKRGTDGTSLPTILVTHGPPKLYLDQSGIRRAGCPHLLAEISRLRPRLHVFGHIHAAHGREDVVLDGVRRARDDVLIGWAGWGAVAYMAAAVLWARVRALLSLLLVQAPGSGSESTTATAAARTTTFVNASAVGGMKNELRNEPVVVEI